MSTETCSKLVGESEAGYAAYLTAAIYPIKYFYSPEGSFLAT